MCWFVCSNKKVIGREDWKGGKEGKEGRREGGKTRKKENREREGGHDPPDELEYCCMSVLISLWY